MYYRRESTEEESNTFKENKMCFRVMQSDDGSFSFQDRPNQALSAQWA